MSKKFNLLLLAGLAFLSSCNLWGGIDKPSGDDQLLSAARACFDRGDYVCAGEYYGQLSTGLTDTRLSESAFVYMAENGVFSISDLVASLGSNRGNGASLTTIANVIAGRGKTDGAIRTALQAKYADAGLIADADLRNYTRFMIALAMVNQVLANAAGTDGVITSADITANPSLCAQNISPGTNCAYPGPGANSLDDTGTAPSGLASAANWGAPATIDMLIVAATDADARFTDLTHGSSNYQGIIQALNTLKNLPGGAILRRQGLLTLLF